MECFVIEDSLSYQNFLKQLLTELHQTVKIYPSAPTFWSHKKTISDDDVFFIDIELNAAINGIQLAKEIRQQNSSAYIVFITNFSAYGLTAINEQIVPFAYLLKDQESIPFTNELTSVIKKIERNSQQRLTSWKTIRCQTALGLTQISEKDILYVQSLKIRNNVFIKTDQAEITAAISFKDIREQLSDVLFFKSFKSFLFQRNKIEHINTKSYEVFFVNGDSLLLSERLIYKLRKEILL